MEATWDLSLHGVGIEDQELLDRTLAETLENVSGQLESSTLEALDSFSLTRGQLEALLAAVRHLADARVQEIGATVAKALASYFQVEGKDAGKEA